jgi:hypothetical protein
MHGVNCFVLQQPVDLKSVCVPVMNEFGRLFPRTFSKDANKSYIQRCALRSGCLSCLAGVRLVTLTVPAHCCAG